MRSIYKTYIRQCQIRVQFESRRSKFLKPLENSYRYDDKMCYQYLYFVYWMGILQNNHYFTYINKTSGSYCVIRAEKWRPPHNDILEFGYKISNPTKNIFQTSALVYCLYDNFSIYLVFSLQFVIKIKSDLSMAASPSQHGRQASRTRNSRLNFSCNSYFWSWISPEITLTISNSLFMILNSTKRKIMILVIMLQHGKVILLRLRMIQTSYLPI